MNRNTEPEDLLPWRFGMAGIFAKSILIAIALTGAAWVAVGFIYDHWGK